jgi:superfamily II DNA or RNA helicase
LTYGFAELIRSFGIPALLEARAHVERDEVTVRPTAPGAKRLFGVVRPSSGGPLNVSARADVRPDGRVELSGDCSCRTGRHCEHVAAVLLSVLGDEGLELDTWKTSEPNARAHRETREVDSWLDRVASAVRSETATPERRKLPQYSLLYLLNREPRRRRLTVHPRTVRVLKGGRFGAAKRCAFTGGPRRPKYVGVDDGELLLAILAHAVSYRETHSFYAPLTIDAESGARLLERLLPTGRCHWRDTDALPLRIGEPRAAGIEWKLGTDGLKRPELVGEDRPEAVWLAVEPPWYVDPREGVAGPLELGVEKQTATALPVPRIVSAEDRESVPVPHLRLHLHGTLPLAKLMFDYDDLGVDLDDGRPTVHQAEGDALIRVRRDFDMEIVAVERLEDMGFVELIEVAPPGTTDEELAGEFLPVLDDEDSDGFLIDFVRQRVPELRDAGWVVEIDDDFPYRVIEGEQHWYADVADGVDETHPWFDLELGVEIAGERHSLLPILVEMLRDPAFALDEFRSQVAGEFALHTADGRTLIMPAKRVQAILGTLIDLFGERPLTPDGALSLSPLHAPLLAELDEALGDAAPVWTGGERTRELGRKLRDFRRIERVAVPENFHGTLRPYQRDGLNWLQFLREHDLAGILADDMGLGKTVQVLAHLLCEKQAGRADRPSLVVAPTSVIGNWRSEAERFARDLRVLVLHGPSRKAHFERLAEYDVVVTTYSLLTRDAKELASQAYHALILDEAQFVKNAKTKASLAARWIEARHRLCLTGTPMENHLGELWSLFHILMPGLLGDQKQFRKLFRTPIEKHGDDSRREQLAARVRPFLLRRTKDEVEIDLPPKSEMTRSIELGSSQRDLYESIRLAMNDKVRQAIARTGLERSTIVILDALLKLRQVCCDPRLLKIEEAKNVAETAKLEALMEMLEEMLEEGRRILLFSQFTSMIALIEQELRRRELPWVKIVGDTRDRDSPVRQFQAGEVQLFLISLKAGGTGLNLTAADTVIHYDPWWNPAVEDQATDRAHRIGQDKPVFVYRLIVSGSVEEKMLALQARKRELAEGIYKAGGAKGGTPLSATDLEVLFQPLDAGGST